MPKIFKKYVCPSPTCRRWYRRQGNCSCGAGLIERDKFSIDYRDGRGARRIEDTDATSKRAAERILSDRVSSSGRGEAKPRREDTFGRAADEYFNLVSKKKADDGKRDEYALRHLREFFSSLQLANIKRRHLEQYLGDRAEAGAAGGTLIKEWNLFKAIWSWAAQHEMVRHVPWLGMKPPASPQAPVRPISEEDEEKLFSSLPDGAREYFRFVALTGSRKSEALRLKKSDIDWDSRIAWVDSAKTRSGRSERQPLHLDDEALQILRDLCAAWPEYCDLFTREPCNQHVFISPKTKQPYKDPKAILRRHAAALGVDLRGVHRLRHLFVTRLIEAEIPEAHARELARHKTTTQIKRYTHLRADHLQEALKRKADRKRNETGNGNEMETKK